MRLPGPRATPHPRLGWAVAALSGVLLAGCGYLPLPDLSSPSSEPALVLPLPGRPYSAAEVLAKLRESPPLTDDMETEGLDPGLVTPEVAAAIAGELYTFDGRPYLQWAVFGGCNWPPSCDASATASVLIAGTPDFGLPESEMEDLGIHDWHTWRIDLSTQVITRDGIQALAGYPPTLDSELDALGRSLAGSFVADHDFGRGFWVEPPGTGQFRLRYDSKWGEWAKSGRWLLVDAREGTLVWLSGPCPAEC